MADSDNIADQAERAIELIARQSMAPHERRRAFEASLPINWLGICDACDEHIEPGRLEANPRVLRCIGCQAEHERNEARR